jgi:hypothetical protein
VPNQVLRETEYQIIMDETLPLPARLKAFRTRYNWLRGLEGAYLDQINQMVHDFGKLGVVERRDGPADRQFPDVMFVETRPGFHNIDQAPADRNLRTGKVPKMTGRSKPVT